MNKRSNELNEISHVFLKYPKNGKPDHFPFSDLSVNEGSTKTLECRVTGNPVPTVTWTKGTAWIWSSKIGIILCSEYFLILNTFAKKYSNEKDVKVMKHVLAKSKICI